MATVSRDYFENKSGFKSACEALYGASSPSQSARFSGLAALHNKYFKSGYEDFFSSPGRIEIVGNHTDHNAGKVLAAAINVDTLAAVSKSADGRIEVKSEGYPLISVDINDYAVRSEEKGTSTAIIRGVLDYYARHGKNLGGFRAVMDSTVPKGSGVSSSSSFELIIAEILNVYYNDGKLDPVFKAKASQYAENVYFGKPCGLMDQSAIALGGVNMIDFRDFENPVIVKTTWMFDDLDIYVIATGGDHSDLTDDYAAIPAEMKSVAEKLGGKFLRDIPAERFFAEENALYGKVSERALLRAEHYYEENVRVEKAFDAVRNADEEGFLAMVNASGESSKVKLQNLYSEKGGDHSIELGLDSSSKIRGVKAYRVHGGGFAGTILLFVEKACSIDANKQLNSIFGESNVFKLSIRDSGAIRVAFKD